MGDESLIMPAFSKTSASRLATCDERLQRIMNEAIKEVDFTVMCGHRGEEEQEDAFRLGRSKVRWPNSKHNKEPSVAVDVAPYPVDWKDTARFARLAGCSTIQGPYREPVPEFHWLRHDRIDQYGCTSGVMICRTPDTRYKRAMVRCACRH